MRVPQNFEDPPKWLVSFWLSHLYFSKNYSKTAECLQRLDPLLAGSYRETKVVCRKLQPSCVMEPLTFGCGSKPMVPFWGRCTTHFRTNCSRDWDVHWGYGIWTHPPSVPRKALCDHRRACRRRRAPRPLAAVAAAGAGRREAPEVGGGAGAPGPAHPVAQADLGRTCPDMGGNRT